VLVPGVGEIAVLGVEAESYVVVAVGLLENVVYDSEAVMQDLTMVSRYGL